MHIKLVPALLILAAGLSAQQPAEPLDPSPINGETYYLVNQLSGFQADIQAGSSASGSYLIQNQRNLTGLTQRWAIAQMPSGNWKLSSISDGLCMDTATSGGTSKVVQQPCAVNAASQEWTFTYTTNGYYTVTNAGTSLNLDVSGGSAAAGTQLVEDAPGVPQSQLWLLRPAFFRGDDNGQLGKQEALRTQNSVPFFNDAGTTSDVLQIMKNHGINLIRLRPTPLVVPGTTTPLYTTYTLGGAGSSPAIPATCTGNGCYANTDAAELAVARRAKQLGMSIELTLFYDGGTSQNAPGAWTGFSVSQTSSAIYAYVKAQIEEYRAAGVMPDVVAIGNEVDTGFLSSGLGSGASGSPGTTFTNFAIYENQGMQAVLDAASDTTLGPAIPAPLRCIHITPAWPINTFFASANSSGINYDLVCQSYYPPYHGALTAAQAASCNTPTEKGGETEDQELTDAASQIGKPILLLEIGEHYENGFLANDCFYQTTRAGQRQFVLDIESAVKSMPNNLAAGFEWWDGTGTWVPLTGGGYANTYVADYPGQLYSWDGFNLFDDGDNGNYTPNTALPTYDSALPALAAVGGKLDATLAYKLVNSSNGGILEVASTSGGSGTSLNTGVDSGVTSLQQQWRISSNGDGYFQIASLASTGGTVDVLDNGSSTAAGALITQQAADSSAGQEWDIVGAGGGTFTIVNKLSGLVAAVDASNGSIEQQTPTGSNVDWITPEGTAQQWKIVPVHITAASSLGVVATPVFSSTGGSYTSVQTVTISDSNSGAIVYYTTDGTTPSASSTKYTSAGITVSSTETIQAIAIASGYTNSSVATATFTITLPAPDFTIALAPSSVTVTASQSGTGIVTITPENGFNASVAFSCSGLPSGATCSFSPTTVTPSGAAITTSLTISAPQSAKAVLPFGVGRVPGVTFAGALVCFVWIRRRRVRGLLLLIVAMIGLAVLQGCGSGSSQQKQQGSTSTVTVTAASGSLQHTASLTFTVQ
jgi:arabinogalactan endo-1,4-beta-galactosidase